MTVQIILFAAVFLTVFLIVLVSFLLRKKSFRKVPVVLSPEMWIDEVAEEVAELEEVSLCGASLFWQPFSVSVQNPEFITGAENGVIYEQDGIHYISKDAFIIDKNIEGELDNDFVKLVESVVVKR